MRRVLAAAAALIAVATGPALAVGLGPLTKEGVIDGPRQAFYLTLYNPYAANTDFVLYPVGETDEQTQDRVSIMPAEVNLGSLRNRQIIVVADRLEVGETYKFRVCAQRKAPPEGISLNARVCSKLSARRIG